MAPRFETTGTAAWAIYPCEVLVVEEDPDVSPLLRRHLGGSAARVELTRDDESALKRALTRHYDLLVLKSALPRLDGLGVCRRLREQSQHVPIIIVAEQPNPFERILGLELGADEYVGKPYDTRELLARIRSVLRRSAYRADRHRADDQPIRHLDLHLDPRRRTARVGVKAVRLTPKEFDLLVHFARHPGRVFSRAQLLDAVWGRSCYGFEHTIDSHINRLRAKIEPDQTDPRFVVTVWGVGYKLVED
ncbi:MAG: response regulator transcription factor [Gammaproteobacteria bacterium]|nr:response regulator transcription factor [Gammaproteobacteria bacterium]